jgi:hypothetical protein
VDVQVRRAAAFLLAGLVFATFSAVAGAGSTAAPAPIVDFTAAVPDMPGRIWLTCCGSLPRHRGHVDVRTAATAAEMTPLRPIGSADDDWVQCGDPIKFWKLDAAGAACRAAPSDRDFDDPG